jgi:two-component system, LytTR family, response regulator
MTIKTVIIEDEKKSLLFIKDIIRQFIPALKILASAGTVSSAVQLIEESKPQLVLMDVHLGDGNGFDVLRQLSFQNFELVFITAYDQYAIEAIKFSAIDYLLKPLSIQEFEIAVAKIQRKLDNKNKPLVIDNLLYNLLQENYNAKKIGVPCANGLEFINIKDIIWLGATGTYTMIYITDGSKIISIYHLGHYEELLTDKNFCRINNNIIINLSHIKRYIKGKGGHVIMTNDVELEISFRKRANFLERLKI